KSLAAAVFFPLVALVLAVSAAPAAAGSIHLKNGRILEGRVIGVSKEAIVVELATGARVAIDRGQIESLLLDDDDPVVPGASRRPKPVEPRYVRRDYAGESYLTQLVELSRLAEDPQAQAQAEAAALAGA